MGLPGNYHAHLGILRYGGRRQRDDDGQNVQVVGPRRSYPRFAARHDGTHARIAASLDEGCFPLRFLSRQRLPGTGAGSRAECRIFQTGVELLGEASPEADAEVVALALRCLEEPAVTGFKLAFGHVGLLDGLLAENVFDEPLRKI